MIDAGRGPASASRSSSAVETPRRWTSASTP